jgi:hypothetical protein
LVVDISACGAFFVGCKREDFWQAYGSTAPKLDAIAQATDNDSREHESFSSGNIMIPVAAILWVH